MSRSIFSPVAAVDVDVSVDAPPAARHAGRRTLTPGQRIIDGRVFYSAAWLDQATSAPPEPPALKCHRDVRGERSAGDAPSERRPDVGPTRVEG